MESGYENRRFSRSEVRIPVSLAFGTDRSIVGVITHLSASGMFVESPDTATAGSGCEAAFATFLDAPIRLRASVISLHPGGMGMEITGIERNTFEAFREVLVDSAEQAAACDTEILSNMESLPELY